MIDEQKYEDMDAETLLAEVQMEVMTVLDCKDVTQPECEIIERVNDKINAFFKAKRDYEDKPVDLKAVGKEIKRLEAEHQKSSAAVKKIMEDLGL